MSLFKGVAQIAGSDREAYYRAQNSRSPRIEYPNPPQVTASSGFGTEMADEQQRQPGQNAAGMLRSPGLRLDVAQDSFLDIEESDAESYRYSDDIPILQRSDENFLDRPVRATGVTFDDLVDRLLAPRMTKAESNFADVFLCLYRKFAAPGDLFAAILVRLDRVRDDPSAHYLSKATEQLRIIEVVAKWVSLYPAISRGRGLGARWRT